MKLGVEKLLKKVLICEMTEGKNVFTRNVFTRNKMDGEKRMILHVKIQTHKAYQNFKIEYINHVLKKTKKIMKKSPQKKSPTKISTWKIDPR